jgi:non-ribosomal peptide synthetase component F
MSFASPFPEVEIPSTSVYDFLFADIDDTHLDRVALVDAKSGRQTSYREMIGRIDAFAGALAGRGIGVGDVVGLLSPNSSGFAVAFHGILRSGATATTINALFTAKDIAKQFDRLEGQDAGDGHTAGGPSQARRSCRRHLGRRSGGASTARGRPQPYIPMPPM